MSPLKPRLTIVVVSLGVLLGAGVAIQTRATKLLKRVDAQYAKVDEGYRRLLWDVRFVQSKRNEADLARFVSHEIGSILRMSDITELRAFSRYWPLLLPRTRKEIKATLAVLKYYIEAAKLEGPSQAVNRAELKTELEARYFSFRHRDGKSCNVSQVELAASLQDLLSGRLPKNHSVQCLESAAQALLTKLEAPHASQGNALGAYRKAIAEERKGELPTEAELTELREAYLRLEERIQAKPVKELEARLNKAFIAAGSATQARKIARWFYERLGFELDGVQYEQKPRPNLNFGGLTYALAPGDIRVLIAPEFERSSHYLKMLVHETGHAVYYTAVRQQLHAYFSHYERGFDELCSDLFLTLFLQPETLSQAPDAELSRLAGELTEPERLKLLGPAASAFLRSMPEYDFQVEVLKSHDRPLTQVATRHFSLWHTAKKRRYPKAFEKQMTQAREELFFVARELNWLISYPLHSRSYVDGALVIAAVLQNRTKASALAWQEIAEIASALRAEFAFGTEREPRQVARAIKIELNDRASLLGGFNAYFGLKAK